MFIRPGRFTDEPQFRDLFYNLSEESIYHRFFQRIRSMPHEKLQEFLLVDYAADMVLVAVPAKADDAPSSRWRATV